MQFNRRRARRIGEDVSSALHRANRIRCGNDSRLLKCASVAGPLLSTLRRELIRERTGEAASGPFDSIVVSQLSDDLNLTVAWFHASRPPPDGPHEGEAWRMLSATRPNERPRTRKVEDGERQPVRLWSFLGQVTGSLSRRRSKVTWRFRYDSPPSNSARTLAPSSSNENGFPMSCTLGSRRP
jgi:hypothetical protein